MMSLRDRCGVRPSRTLSPTPPCGSEKTRRRGDERDLQRES
jgi:hypothetical protein